MFRFGLNLISKLSGFVLAGLAIVYSIFQIRQSGVRQGHQEYVDEATKATKQQVESKEQRDETINAAPPSRLRTRLSRWMRKGKNHPR